MGQWLRLLLVFVGEDTTVTTTKRAASQEACVVMAATLTEETFRRSPLIEQPDIAYRCAEIGESDPAMLAKSIAADLAKERQ